LPNNIGVISNGTLYTNVLGEQGNVETIINQSNGTVAGNYTYDAFGNQTNGSTAVFPYNYNNQYYDSETGLYYANGSYYDSSNGLYTQKGFVNSNNPVSANSVTCPRYGRYSDSPQTTICSSSNNGSNYDFSALDGIGDLMHQASEDFAQASVGLGQMVEGIHQMTQGINQASAGMTQMSGGLDQINSSLSAMDLSSLNLNLSSLNLDLSSLNFDLSSLNFDFGSMSADFAAAKKDFSGFSLDLAPHFDINFSNMDLKLDFGHHEGWANCSDAFATGLLIGTFGVLLIGEVPALIPALIPAADIAGTYGNEIVNEVEKAPEILEEVGNAVRFTPMDEGPLSESIANTFRSGTYNKVVTQGETTLYRAYGGSAGEIGSYCTRTPPSGPLQSVIDSALDQNWGNTATQVSRIRVPSGTTIYEGYAASQGGLVGGGNQIYIEGVNPSWIIK